jgi:hypothetical protein
LVPDSSWLTALQILDLLGQQLCKTVASSECMGNIYECIYMYFLYMYIYYWFWPFGWILPDTDV